MSEIPFWREKRLEEMTTAQWESLCDGCARCCLIKLEDVDDGAIYYTQVSCRYLKQESCRCKDYQNRQKNVPTCLWLTPQNIGELNWLPTTCAYRLIYEGKDLPAWHPLISGDANSVHQADISVRDKVISEDHIHPEELEDHIIAWVKC